MSRENRGYQHDHHRGEAAVDGGGGEKGRQPPPDDAKAAPARIHMERSHSITETDEQITFSWEGLTIQSKGSSGGSLKQKLGLAKGEAVKKPPKVILNKASGYVKPGELLAIMGASGAGKSTLLNALTFKNLAGLDVVSGKRYANGVPVTPNSLTSVSAYVQQDDLFIGTLTVREQLEFQALVRMDKHIPRKDRMRRVDEVLKELGLAKCQRTLIGVQGRIKGISGGEMKRLAFACEVLTNPPLFFCDEPTSGLDSYMAGNVVDVLRLLARQGKTVVCTIHQPSSQIFERFDRLLLMAEGRVAYLGDAREAVRFFSGVGFPCPLNYNPADHYVHVLAVVPGNEAECRGRIRYVCEAFEESDQGKQVRAVVSYQKGHAHRTRSLTEGTLIGNKSPYRANWWEQFTALLWRSWLSVIKEPMVMQVRFMQTILIAAVLGIIYWQQDYNQQSVMNINGALFLCLTNMTFQNMFAVVNVFCMELPIFLREHFNGCYRVDTYYIAKQLAELPVYVVTPIIFIAIFYWMAGLNPDAERFLIAVAVMLVLTQVVVGFGYFISCAASNLQMALAIAPPLIIPIMLFGGMFLNVGTIPDWLSWMQYISWFKYSNELLVINQWDGVNNITCDSDRCPYDNGNDVIDSLSFDKDNIVIDWILLGVLAVAFRILGFVALMTKTYRKSK